MTFTAFEGWAIAKGISSKPRGEEQNGDYESGTVELSNGKWHIRTAKITPKKPGAFVAFWSRGISGETEPFTKRNVGAGLLLFVSQGSARGIFIFTAEHLNELGITADSSRGKRGFRVYPDWCTELNSAAQRTQLAQSAAFTRY